MKKSELIKALEAIPGDPNVQLMDMTIQHHYADDECSNGLHHKFTVEHIGKELTEEELREYEHLPWIALTYESNKDDLILFVEDLTNTCIKDWPGNDIDKIREIAKEKIGYDHIEKVIDKKQADSCLYFWMQGFQYSLETNNQNQ